MNLSWWPILQFAVTAFVGAYVWVEQRQRATRDQLEAVRAAHETRLDATERAMAAVTERIAHLPNSTEFHRLEVAVTELRGEVRGSIGAMTGKLDSVHHRTQLIEEFLGTIKGAKS